jgi:poly(A) polymerase
MKDVLVMQQKFTNRRGARALRMLEHKRFRAAFDFLELRARCGDADAELARWWDEVQGMAAQEQREALQVRRQRRTRPRRRRRGTVSQASPSA